MRISGLQKMTLLDYPGLVACTVFTGGCNLRCPFCHNASLVLPERAADETDEAEVFRFLEKRQGMLDGVAFTGGEPLLRRELPELLRAVRDLGYAVKLDTNGTRPDALKAVLDAHLADYVAMDVKNSPDRYAETCGVDAVDLDAVRESIALLRGGDTDYEFRTTVVDELHDEESIAGVGELIHGARRCFLQPFRDRDTVAFAGFHAPDAEKLERFAAILRPHAETVEIRGGD